MKRLTLTWLFLFSISVVFSQSLNVNFNQGEEGWKVCHVNYLNSGDSLADPEPFAEWALIRHQMQDRRGFGFSGQNTHPDFFIYLEKEITGLIPNKTYKIIVNSDWIYYSYDLSEDVKVKFGAFTQPLEKTENRLLQNLGIFPSANPYRERKIIHNYTEPFMARTDSSGRLFLSIGLEPNQMDLQHFFLNTLRIIFIENGDAPRSIEPSEISFRPDTDESMIFFDSEHNEKITSLYIYTEEKEMIKAYIFESPSIKKAFEIESLSKGTYLIEFVFEDGQIVTKTFTVD